MKQLHECVRDGIICGAAILAGDGREERFSLAFGQAGPEPDAPPMTLDTIIDIASVTKAVVTVTALLICRDRGLLELDAPFTRYLAAYRPKLAQPPTVRQLANHTSGFTQAAAGPRIYEAETGPETLRNVCQYPPAFAPGAHFQYACWNYLLLGLIIEQLTGESLIDFARRELFAPLGMRDTSLGRPVTAERARLATTFARGPGELSDLQAFRIYRDGGAAGNAGAFSTARDLAKFCRCLLAGGSCEDGRRLFSPAGFRELFARPEEGFDTVRSLGWIRRDANCPPAASGCQLYHSGWSGQTVFIDFDRQCYVVVLTPRHGDYERAKAARFAAVNEILETIPINRREQ